MFDVFTEEIEITIKDGLSNLYWYRGDLLKAWLRSGVKDTLAYPIYNLVDENGKNVSKRKMMDLLYEKLREVNFNQRLEISRNFARILIEQKTFVPQDQKHRIDVAERCALKLHKIYAQQQKEYEERDRIKRQHQEKQKDNYESSLLLLQEKLSQAKELTPQKRGYELEKIFTELMKINGILIEGPFSIPGEQVDGLIKYDSHYYIVELKWKEEKIQPNEVGAFYYKVTGRPDTRGIFLSMNGFTDSVKSTATMGKDIQILLFDGVHLANVIYGMYRFTELLDYALYYATKEYSIFCPYTIQKS